MTDDIQSKGAASSARATNPVNYGLFQDVFFRDGGRKLEDCRLDLSDERAADWCDRIGFHASSCAGMLAVHIRRVHELLALACDEVDPHPPSTELIAELAWSLGELDGLRGVIESIEGLADRIRAGAANQSNGPDTGRRAAAS